jgi:hypothetical protein
LADVRPHEQPLNGHSARAARLIWLLDKVSPIFERNFTLVLWKSFVSVIMILAPIWILLVD